MFKSLIVFLAIVQFTGAGTALPLKKVIKQPTKHYQLKIDSSKITLRQFDEVAIKRYKSDPAFNYVAGKNEITWWDRFWNWIWSTWDNFWAWIARMLEKLFGGINAGKHAASVMKWLLLGTGIALLVYVTLKLIGIDLLKIFRKKQDGIEVPYTESLENIHEINFDEGLENALLIKNYRLAVRLLYLRCLKQLNDGNLISWKIGKTNTAYINDIKDEEQRKQFALITRQFEYVWYGDFPVDGQSFQSINSVFMDFKQLLS